MGWQAALPATRNGPGAAVTSCSPALSPRLRTGCARRGPSGRDRRQGEQQLSDSLVRDSQRPRHLPWGSGFGLTSECRLSCRRRSRWQLAKQRRQAVRQVRRPRTHMLTVVYTWNRWSTCRQVRHSDAESGA